MSESQQFFEYPPVRARIVALVASVAVATASGTPYVYSVFAPQLVKNSKLPVAALANLSLALTLGSAAGGFPAGLIIDHFGPGPADFIGAIFQFTAFSLLHKIYITQSQNIPLLMLALVCVGFGSILSFYSTVKCATANFPHHRGSAGALPVSAYALASLLYSSIAVHFFKDDTAGLLKFFSIFCPTVCLSCSFFLKIYKKEKKPSPTSSPNSESAIADERTTVKTVASTASMLSMFHERRRSLRGSLSFWGIGVRSPRGSISSFTQENRPLLAPELRRSDSSVIYSAVEDVPVFVRENSPVWNHYIVKAICQRLFLKYYFILASLQGIGQMYIYSVGFIVVAQVNSTPDNKLSVGQSQALQVSTIAIASFLGRLTSGPISDIFRRKFHAQRIWCIFFASSLMGLGQHLTSIFDTVQQITLCSFITGFAFGFVFGTFPAVVADRFGTEGFSTVWGLMTTGGIITVSQLTRLFGYYLGKHTDPDGVCRAGVECYRDAFVFTQWASLFISALILVTIYINHRLGTKG